MPASLVKQAPVLSTGRCECINLSSKDLPLPQKALQSLQHTKTSKHRPSIPIRKYVGAGQLDMDDRDRGHLVDDADLGIQVSKSL